MVSGLKVNSYVTKKRYSAMLIFCIFCAQFAYSTIIYNLKYITNSDFFWISLYHTFALIFAIPQSGLSDNRGRKKHLIFSLFCVLLSVALFILIYVFVKISLINVSQFSFFTVFPICLLAGVTGNVIPIARAGLADLKIHDFRAAMGWSTIFIGFGWVAPILLGLIFFPLGVMISSIIILLFVILIVKKFFFDPEDSSIRRGDSVIKISWNSYRWFASMFLVAGGAFSVFAYLFSEISFYQIYSLVEDGVHGPENQVVGLIMAFGYAFGIIIQWIVYCSDESGIKFGSLLSLTFLFVIFCFKLFSHEISDIVSLNNYYIIEGILNFSFSFGFGFLIPSLFSLMAKRVHPHHAGRLFGAIDFTDTLALNISAFILFLKEKLSFNDSVDYTVSLALFGVSFVFYKYFLRRFSSYEKYP